MTRFLFSVILTSAMLAPLVAQAEEVVVYSARNEHLIKPLFDRYTQQTGVEIRYITDKAGPLLQRLKAEGRRTPADMLITVDAGNLVSQWADRGPQGNDATATQPTTQMIQAAIIPYHLYLLAPSTSVKMRKTILFMSSSRAGYS